MNIKSLSLSKFMGVNPDRRMESEINNILKELKSSLPTIIDELLDKNDCDTWYIIEPEGITFDLSHLKLNMEAIKASHIVLDFDAIRLNLFNELSDFHKLTYTVHNPIFGTEKLGMSPFGLIVRGNILYESFKVLKTMLIHGLSTVVMLTPIIYRTILQYGNGILLTEVPTKGSLVKKEYNDEELQIIRSYIETLIGDKTDKFIEEFSYAIK